MVIMALDHTRDFFSIYHGDPLNIAKAGGILFFTRWITHFCAPVFIFLAGTGIYLRHSRGASNWEMSKYLASRGVVLILLELVFMQPVFSWPLTHATTLVVMWVIGCCMILMSGVIWMPNPNIDISLPLNSE